MHSCTSRPKQDPSQITQMIIILFPRESGITASVLSTGNEVLTDGKRRGKTDMSDYPVTNIALKMFS